ncbi:MAG: KilA-N domain-containing protein [Saezia sp.]
MYEIIINNEVASQDKQGRYCLNDVHKAAGNLPEHEPAQFIHLDSTQKLIEEIKYVNLHSSEHVRIVMGRNGGAYVSKELVYAYAMWVSPAFHLVVIRAFDEAVTKQMQWQQARYNGKLVRREFTDTLKQLVEYSIAQGSRNPDKHFMNYTKLGYSVLDFAKDSEDKNLRDSLSLLQHNQMGLVEYAIQQAILEGMQHGMHYKEIYQLAKVRANELASMIKRLTGQADVLQLPKEDGHEYSPAKTT